MEKHQQIREQIELKIASGAYPTGARLPTEIEFCEQFNAARATIARALRSLEEAGLIQRRRGSGTFVRPPEAQGKTKTIGLLIPGVGDGEIFEPVCCAIAAHATEYNLRIAWHQIAETSPEKRAQAALKMCRQYIYEGVDGLFFEPLELVSCKDDTNHQIIRLMRESGIPVVLIDADISYPQRSNLDLAGVDNFRVGILLAEHLLQQGCHAPVFLHRPGSATTTQARAAGFLSVLAANKCSIAGRVIETEPDCQKLPKHLTGKLKADGVACGNDYTAALLMKNLQVAGIQIPEQIKLIGVDNLKYARLLGIPLTTLAQPCSDIGLAALELMRFRIDHPDAPPRQVLLDTPLIERESTCC